MGSHSRGSLPAEAAVPLSLFRSHCARRPSSTLPYLSCYQQPYPTDGRTRPEPTNGNRLARKPAIISLDQSRGSLRRRRRRHYSVTSHQQPPDTTSRGDAFTPLALVSNTDRLLSLPPAPILAPSRFSLAFSLPRLDHHPSSSSLSLSLPPIFSSPPLSSPRVASLSSSTRSSAARHSPLSTPGHAWNLRQRWTLPAFFSSASSSSPPISSLS